MSDMMQHRQCIIFICVLHAWQDMHTMRAENPIKIEEMMQLLKELPQLEVTPENVPRLCDFGVVITLTLVQSQRGYKLL